MENEEKILKKLINPKVFCNNKGAVSREKHTRGDNDVTADQVRRIQKSVNDHCYSAIEVWDIAKELPII